MTTVTAGNSEDFVFIGRFRPYHKGHEKVVKTALSLGKRLFIAIGSANRPRTIRNPWLYNEVVQYLGSCHADAIAEGRLHFVPIDDFLYNDDRWLAGVHERIGNAIRQHGNPNATPSLIGLAKDVPTSFYLSLFPSWNSVPVTQTMVFDATSVRYQYLSKKHQLPREILPEGTYAFLRDFMETSTYASLVELGEFLKGYKKAYGPGPFLTVDAVVRHGDKILMVRRGKNPGRGLLALPGGFVDPKETLDNAVLRELDEETTLNLSRFETERAFRSKEVFDDPYRDERGRLVTQAYLFDLTHVRDLPPVVGQDDAAEAMWMPIKELDPTLCYSDHWDIVQKMTGSTNRTNI